MVEEMQDGALQKDLEEIKNLFMLLDKDGNGRLDAVEVSKRKKQEYI
jgi:Ca2+-binding EF-hand superfamily protein